MGREWSAGSPEGWYADPHQRHERRYWNGEVWAPYVSDQGVVALDPVDDPPRRVAASTHEYGPRGLGPEPARTDAVPEPAVAGVAPAPAGTPHWAAAPRPSYNPNAPQPPATAWAPPTPPGAQYRPPFPPPTGAQPMIGTPIRPFYRAPWFLVLSGIIVLLFIAGGAAIALRPGPERIDAGPAAPTPAGFRMLSVDDYELAIPQGWEYRELNDDGVDALEDFARLNGAETGSADLSDNLTGTKVTAANLATGESIGVLPFKALSGDPGDPDTLASIESSMTTAMGAMSASVEGFRTNVHGFPAAQLSVRATVAGQPVFASVTVIQTGDHVYEVVVSSPTAARTDALTDQVLPTFDPH
jgi:hypothetical protein